MKKVFLKITVLASITFTLISCGTSQNIAQTPDETEKAVAQTHEEIADIIAEEINQTAADEIKSSKEENPYTEEALSSVTEQKTSEEDNEIISSEAEALSSTEETFNNPSEKSHETETSEEEITSHKEEASTAEAQIQELTEFQTDTEKKEEEERSENTAEVSFPESDSNDAFSDISIEPEVRLTDNENETEEVSEKVSDEDSSPDQRKDKAPTSDEKNKVLEPPVVIEEPEVNDLVSPEEDSQNSEESKDGEENAGLLPDEENPDEDIQTIVEVIGSPESEETEPAPSQTAEPEEALSKTDEEEALPSRSVTLNIGQYLDIVYPGKGWVYIGENDSKAVFNYFGRKLGTEDTTFALRAKNAGETLLHFYKNDSLTGEYIEDWLKALVLDKKSSGRVKAPSYAEIIPPKPQARLERQAEKDKESAEEKEAQKASTISEFKEAVIRPENKKASEVKKSEKFQKTKALNKESDKKEKAESVKKAVKEVSEKVNTSSMRSDQTAASLPGQQNAPESDVKTVIQTTGSVKNNEAPKTAEAPAPQRNDNAVPENREVYNYTPLSSESSQVQANQETEEIQSEPEVNSPLENIISYDESLLEKAKKDFADKKYSDALTEAQEYYNNATTRLDEALFLLGQLSESNSQVKDIRFAVESYEMLLKRFPQSKYWKEAKNRSIYLKRYYIDIR